MAPGFRGRLVCAAVLVCTACGGDSGGAPPAIDAAPPPDARGIADASPEPDRIDPLLWVQFSAVGCARGGADQEPCEGNAPLSVAFSAAAPAAIDTYLWTFGDGTPTATDPRPTHVYEQPGVYDVSLTVGGPGGTASSLRVGFVSVAAGPVGASCAEDSQCEQGLSCLCGDGQACRAGVPAGFCTRGCDRGIGCPAGSVCADLTAAAGDEPWQAAICLAGCEPGCRSGLSCRELVGGDEPWVEACFAAGVLRDIGASCFDGASQPAPSACTSGDCAVAGARGQCSAVCETSADCPSSAACATFNGGGRRCLARCASADDCVADPWLSCAPPGAAGALGFVVDEEPPAEAGYCAPTPCAAPADCPGGACVDGHCTAVETLRSAPLDGAPDR